MSGNNIDLEELAARLDIPGLTLRRFRGTRDLPAMVSVVNRSEQADGMDYVLTIEQMANRFAHLTNTDPYQDLVLIEVSGELVGYNSVRWWQELEGTRIYFHYGFLLTEWRGRGIEEVMLDYGERRLRQIAASHPADVPRFFSTYAFKTQQDKIALLRRWGYEPVRHFYEMIRDGLDDLPPAPLPPGLEVRPVEPDQYRAIWEANEEAFRDHWGYGEKEEEDYQRWLGDPQLAPDLWQVAWDGDQIAGVALNSIDEEENAAYNRKRGYVEDLSVRRPWRGRGLGRALLVRSLALFRERGMTEAVLGVDTENPTGALRLYESVGFRPLKESASYRKPLQEGDG